MKLTLLTESAGLGDSGARRRRALPMTHSERGGMNITMSRLFLGLGIAAALMLGLARSGFAVLATGGDTTNDIGGYRIHTFNNTGTFSVTVGGNVELLMVAGGGGGGADVGGGGGAGGLIYSNVFPVVSSNYTVTVGAGGGGSLAAGTNGADSVFGSLAAKGGGGGAGWRTGNGLSGGSGGGGYGDNGSGTTLGGTNNASGQGNAGGIGFRGTVGSSSYGAGGGGGGAGTTGSPGTSAGGGNGGAGLQFSISGSSLSYAGGGAGCDDPGSYPGTGGLGGGGNGNGQNATANTGGGGGGGGGANGGRGGNGGSGIVILKYSIRPVVDNANGATNVTLTSAWLNGTLAATGGAPASVFVYWGPNDGSNSATAWANTNAFADYQPQGPLTTNVTGLSSNTIYYYRFCATNSFGVSWAPSSSAFVASQTSVTATDPTGRADPTDTAAFTVYRSAACTAADLIVNYVLSGTATNATDYTIAPVSGAVVIPKGQTNGAIVVTPQFKVDGQRTVVLTLATGPYVIGSANSATCTLAAIADAPGVYAGGSYDGYDAQTNLARIGYPSVNNAQGATNVTYSGASLNGSLLSTGSAPTTAYVYWGPTDGGTNQTSWSNSTSFGVCAAGQALSTNVTLSPPGTYYYRFYATNGAGEDAWAVSSASFNMPSPPLVTIGTPVASFTTAILRGSLVTSAGATIIIYWGQNTNAWANTNNIGTWAQGEFATGVSGLSQGAAYYYRCYGTNVWGEGWSQTAVFTTRVPFAIFSGGSYDGYDAMSRLNTLSTAPRGTVILFR